MTLINIRSIIISTLLPLTFPTYAAKLIERDIANTNISTPLPMNIIVKEEPSNLELSLTGELPKKTSVRKAKHHYRLRTHNDSSNWLLSHESTIRLTTESISRAETHVTVPTAFDVRSTDPFFPPPSDQETLGSCSSNAILDLVRYVRDTEGMKPEALSRIFLYFNARNLERHVDSDAGANISTGLRALQTYGVCSEAVCPYDITQFKTKPSQVAYNEALRTIDLDTFSVIHIQQSLDVMKYTLSVLKKPFVFSMKLFASFNSNVVKSTGIVPTPKKRATGSCYSRPKGLHAVLAVGYDDEKKMFTIRNSWGDGWGDHGYFYLPYDYMVDPNLTGDFWSISKIGGKPVIHRKTYAHLVNHNEESDKVEDSTLGKRKRMETV